MATQHEVIIIGGGLAGSITARKLAAHGHSVLVLEHETEFRDRVRGEQLHPWGGAAARRLGVYDELIGSCGHDARYWDIYLGGHRVSHRDLHTTSPHGIGSLNFFHPRMQETLLGGAIAAGADVRRGATVVAVTAGATPSVTFELEGQRHTHTARLVIGADGRASRARRWGELEVKRDREHLRIAGVLVDRTPAPDDALHMCVGPDGLMLLVPHGGQRARIYFIHPSADGRRLSGKDALPEFLRLCRAVGACGEWLDGIEVVGPLAEFEGAGAWVDHPYRDGIALIGDAAGALDPSWGCGMSKTLLDVEHLTSVLTSGEPWQRALDRYAEAHDRRFQTMLAIEASMARLLYTPGAAGDACRARVMPMLMAGDRRLPDIIGLGPEGPHDERAFRLMRGEDDPLVAAS